MKNLSINLSALHIWLLSLINLALIATTLFLLTQTRTEPESAPIPQITEAPAPKTDQISEPDIEALNPYGQAVVRAGLLSCARPMNELTDRLLMGQKVGAYRFPETNPDFASMSLEVGTQSGPTMYMTFNMGQFPGGVCQIAFEAYSHWGNSCKDVVESVYKDFKPTRALMDKITLLTHSQNENRKVFTMPVAAGCIVIEKEIVNTKPITP